MPSDSTPHRRVRARGEEVRSFILANIEKSPGIAQLVTEKLGISRQAANKHLRELVAEGVLVKDFQQIGHMVTLTDGILKSGRHLQENVAWE